jgi:hypothetical protein
MPQRTQRRSVDNAPRLLVTMDHPEGESVPIFGERNMRSLVFCNLYAGSCSMT